MENTGIMQEVKELLASGKSSREVIDAGYAPGTVYKVQHSLRQVILRQKETAHPQEELPSVEEKQPTHTEILEDELSVSKSKILSLEAELQRLDQTKKAEISALNSKCSHLNDELRSTKEQKTNLETKIKSLEGEKKLLEQQLDETRSENFSLKRYLSSKNCGWRKELGLFIQKEQQLKEVKLGCRGLLVRQLCTGMT